MKIKYLLTAACCLPVGLMAQNSFTIHGKVGSLDAPAKAYLSYRIDGNEVLDSAFLHNGQFTFNGKLTSPLAAVLTLKHDATPITQLSRRDQLSFYLENSDIKVAARDSISRGTITGSAIQNDADVFRALQQPYLKLGDSLSVVYSAWTAEQRKDTGLMKSFRIALLSTQAGFDSVSRIFIARHPDSYFSLLTFQSIELKYDFNPDTAAAKFAKFTRSLRESAGGKKIAAIIDIGKKTNTGAIAMDFVQNDTTGKAVKLSSYRGQYVLVDFWASWCKPCRAENPNLLKAYQKYKSKNFTILSVSLDSENGRKAWLDAVEKDGLPWTQVSDLRGFHSTAATLYGISAIPSNFLIDPNGKILAKNLRGDDLDINLSKLLPM